MTVGPRVLGGRYALVEMIGSGGMADVHRATDRVLERDVAVKVLRSTTSGTTEHARFAAEARTLAALNHPGLVTLLDAGIADEHPYLVMELVDGPTLGGLIREHGPLDPDRVRTLGRQLAEALAYAHASGVVHRDVKPGNILVRPDGRAVLTDFGIARLIDDVDHHTNTGDVIGSPAYLSPEQVNGAHAGTAVDVYSLGLVLLEALTGTRAYAGSPVEAAIARLTTPPTVPVSLDHDLRDLVVAMTALLPEDRPTALEVTALLDGDPHLGRAAAAAVATGPLDLADRTGASATLVHTGTAVTAVAADPVRRRRTGVLVAAAVVAVLLAATGLAQLRPDSVEATPAPTSTPTATPTATPVVRAAVVTRPSPTRAPVVRKAPAKKVVAKAPKPAKHKKVKHGKGHGKGHGKR